MINHYAKIILLSNPGSTERIAKQLGIDHDTLTLPQAKEMYSEFWESYTVASFVRPPLDRLIAAYSASPQELPLDGVLRNLIADPGAIENDLYKLQSSFITDVSELDFIGRYDRIDVDWLRLHKILGVWFDGLPRVDVKTDLKFYSPAIIAMATHLYRPDFARFKFSLPVPHFTGRPTNPIVNAAPTGCSSCAKARGMR